MHKDKRCINGEYLDCKMLFVMMRHLNSLNYLSLGIESLWSQPIHVWLGLHYSDNFERQRSNVLKYPSDLRRISCHGRNYSQPYFFKRNQSSDNRSHGFGTKFLLKKFSASDFSYEKSAFI